MMYLSVALLCFAVVPGSFSYNDIHNFMTPEEVQRVFNTDHDSVPQYEIVRFDWTEKLHKRDLSEGRKIHIRAFGEDINLWLHPRDSILVGENTPVYYAKSSPTKPNGVEYKRKDRLMPLVGRIFEDPDTLASFVIGTENSGRARVNGFIESENLSVRSLPSRVAEEYRRRRQSADDFDDFESDYHVIYRTSDSPDINYPELPTNLLALHGEASENLSAIPDTLYPEILVTVEYSITKAFGKDLWGLLQYLIAFWNGVDLKFRSLEDPKFELHISGFIIAQDSLATPYISNTSLNENTFDSSEALAQSGQFFFAEADEFPTDSYDIAVTMTRQNFGVGNKAGIIGIAYRGSACANYGYNSTFTVAIVQDDGAFKYVIVAAHELGHLLGSPHDHPNQGCATEDGHIMSFTPWYTKNTSDFSNCTLKYFDKSLNESRLDCLYNKPEPPGKSLPRLMPGRIIGLEEQCHSLRKESSCEAPDVCVEMYCMNKNGICQRTGQAASDGTSCGENKFCLHMECVSL